MASGSDNSFLISVRELIDTAFGDVEKNIVNHKLIQTILLLLARQLRMLERRVEVEINPMALRKPRTSLSISEIKIHAMQKDKKASSGKDRGGKIGRRDTQTGHDKSSSSSSSTEKISSDLTSSGDKRSSLQTSTSGKTTSSADKSSTDKTSTTKSSSDKTSTEKSSTLQSSTDKSSSDKTSTDKSSTLQSSTDKSSSDKTSTDKSSRDKTSSDKTSTEKTSSDQTSSGKISTDKSSTEKSSGQKSSTDTDPTSSLKRATLGTIHEVKKLEKIQSLLEIVEERRERELRVIHQRTDSKVDSDKTPTPMASLDSIEAQYEKLLIVERVPSDEAKAKAAGKSGTDQRGRTRRLSVVTQEEFRELETIVYNLQKRFAPIGEASFPENIQLMQELRKGASLTDAMAALQLAARLEASEKTLQKMMSIVTDLAKQTPGINLTSFTKTTLNADQAAGATTTSTPVRGPNVSDVSTKTGTAVGKSKSVKHATETVEITPYTQSSESVEIELLAPQDDEEELEETGPGAGPPVVRVTYSELDMAMQELQDEIMKSVVSITTRSANNADNVMKQVNKFEKKVDAAINLSSQMPDLEKLVADYAEQINILDTSLSSQMTSYQDQLTQMQHDLECGLETMAEALANTGGDTVAVAELNGHFTNLQMDFDTMKLRQRDLQSNQQALSLDLNSLWKQIEVLRESKSDREEVVDALRDKAGIKDLNGLVSLQQFEAVRGDFEKRIGAAYDKFNNQEIVWQKAIDELMRELNEKAELVQVYSLKDDINKHLNDLKSRLDAMLEVVGEPRAAAISKRLHRDAACLSCATPAHIGLEEPGKVPALPGFQTARQPAVGAKTRSKPKGDGDHRLCYPGLPIPHPIDPRAHVCNRYCGGSHTRITTNGPARSPQGIFVNPIGGDNVAPGTDGKMYKIDSPEKKPCSACNVVKSANPEIKVNDPEPKKEEHCYGSNMTPSDFIPMSQVFVCEEEDSNATPPPPIEHDSLC